MGSEMCIRDSDIVEYRQENGPFKTAADLSNVKGIGSATVEKNLQRILL